MLEERIIALEVQVRDILTKLAANPPKGISGYDSKGGVTEIPNPDDQDGSTQKD